MGTHLQSGSFAPLVIYLAMLPDTWVGPVVVAIIWFALIGDILDGIIARYFGIATPLMRRADSIADLIFWLGVGTAIWLWRPEIFRPHLWWIRIALLMECFTYVVSFLKFGKELAAHAYSGKLLGIGILLGIYASLVDRSAAVDIIHDVDSRKCEPIGPFRHRLLLTPLDPRYPQHLPCLAD